MDAFEYRFTSKTGDIYIVRILNDGARFLSSEMISALEKSDVEVWGIYLNRVGSYKHVTGIRDLSLISNQIYSFFRSHDNAILYYVCDDIADVPMNARKKAEGFSVQYYRNRLFTSLFYKLQGLLDMNVVDLPICIDACGNDMYIHIMVRKEQLDVAKRIKQDVLDGFSKQGRLSYPHERWDKDYKSMFPCYYVEKTDEVREYDQQSFTLKDNANERNES